MKNAQKTIVRLINEGRMVPIIEPNADGVPLIVGYRRKGSSRKSGSDYMLKRSRIHRPHGSNPALTIGANLVMDERRRQVKIEGYSAAHDERHDDGALARAAECYEAEPTERKMVYGLAIVETARGLADPDAPVVTDEGRIPMGWPWEPRWWKPSTRVRDLTKAGALFLAEADRLKRIGDAEGAEACQARALNCARKIDDLYDRAAGL